MKPGELRQFLWTAPAGVAGEIFVVISARQTLADFLMDGNLYKNWDINFVERHSKVIDESR